MNYLDRHTLQHNEMEFVGDLLQRAEQQISWHQLFKRAIENIREAIPADEDDKRFVRAAECGIRYLVESSATDNAARGRASSRLNSFITTFEHSRRR
jgi:hypothetical protein